MFLRPLVVFLAFMALTAGANALGPAPTMAKPYLVAPLVLDGIDREEAWVYPRENIQTGEREVFVEAESLFNLLDGKFNQERIESLKKAVTAQGTLNLRSLQASGLEAEFDLNSLELRLTIPLRYRESSELVLHKTNSKEKVLRPELHSGYLNLRVSQGYRHETQETDPLNARVDLVENINGFVLESGADFQDRAQYPWRRQDTRIRKDDEQNMIRYTLGDLTLSSQGLQEVPAMAGLSIAREFSIQPYRTLRPLSATEVSIKRTSIISVFINGFLYSEVRVNPGVFNIRDFPLALGKNNVRIKVRDDLGQEEFYEFSMVFENSILTKGLSEFTYSAGMPWETSGADRKYNDQNIFTHVFHRYGLTESLTLGLNFQNFNNLSLAGLESSAATGIGYISGQWAQSKQPGHLGLAQRYQYRSYDHTEEDTSTISFKADYEIRDKDFSAINQSRTFNSTFKNRAGVQISFQPYVNSYLLSVGGGKTENFITPDQEFYNVNVVLNFRASLRMELGYTKDVGPAPEERGHISLNWVERAGIYSANAYYDTLQKTTNLSASRNNPYKYDDYRVAVNAQNSEIGQSVNTYGEYLTQPATFRLEQYSSQQSGIKNNVTTLGLNTGIAWTGSSLNGHHAAITQPISDSFTLFKAENLPNGHSVVINPVNIKGEAEVGSQSVAVRDQTGYYNYTLNVDTTSLPVGYPLDKEFFKVQPTYRSGVFIPLKFKLKIMVKGRLLDAQNKPIGYTAGDILNSKGELVDNTFFTNKQGRFFIEGLEPGTYQIVTDKPDLKPINVEVFANENNSVDLRDVVIGNSGE